MLRLINPSARYLQSYYQACVVSWGKVHNDYIIHNPADFASWSQTIFDDYQKQRKGIGLPPGFVPSVTYWLVDTDSAAYIGTVNIRMRLTDTLADYGGHVGFFIRADKRNAGLGKKIFKLSLAAARRLRISPILYMCTVDNEASLKVLLSAKSIRHEYGMTVADGQYCKVGRFWFS